MHRFLYACAIAHIILGLYLTWYMGFAKAQPAVLVCGAIVMFYIYIGNDAEQKKVG